jgi:5-methyltetrahydrofolate--homocysteine methyltransferase
MARPNFMGARVIEVPLEVLRPFIDWTPFFHTWELKGVYPRIFEHENYGAAAKQLFAEGNELLDELIANKALTARGVYGFFAANSDGDDIQLYDDKRSDTPLLRLHHLRQQAVKDGEPSRCLSDFVAPTSSGARDYVGAFAVTTGIGLHDVITKYKAAHDDYNAIMAEALADRLAEAFAEYLHKQVRVHWGYGEAEQLSSEDLIWEKYRGIRPAPGYPACPDHTEKGTLWKLLDVEKNTGIKLTESYAMWPGSSVSGFYFAHPESRYFSVGKIDRDQVEDYAARKGMTVAEAERWLSPNLGYDPAR